MEKEFKLKDKKEIEDILRGHGLNSSFVKHIISLFEKKEKEFIKKLKDAMKKGTFNLRQSLEKIDELSGFNEEGE